MDPLPALPEALTWPPALVLAAWIVARSPLALAAAEKWRARNGHAHGTTGASRALKDVADMATLRADLTTLDKRIARVEGQSKERDDALDKKLAEHGQRNQRVEDKVDALARDLSECRAEVAHMSGQLEGLPDTIVSRLRE